MMNLVSRCSERTPDVLASTASESPEKTRHESQLLLSSWTEQHRRTERPVLDAYSSNYLEWNAGKNWSSQEWKSDELMEVRTGRPVVCSQRASQTRFSRDCKNVIWEEEANHDRTVRPVVCSQRAHQFVIEDDETESELSLGSRSFLHRRNDQVRKKQKQSSKNAIEDSEEHSVIWRMFVSSTLEASVFMGKNDSDNWHSISNTEKISQ